MKEWRSEKNVPHLSVFREIDEIDDLAKLAWAVGDCTLWLDELDRACENKRWSSPYVRRIVHEGRHRGVSLWGTFRFTSSVPEDLLSIAHKVFFFHVGEMGLYELRGIMQRLGPSYAETIPTLARGECVVWEDTF